jgi:hypothetical protein
VNVGRVAVAVVSCRRYCSHTPDSGRAAAARRTIDRDHGSPLAPSPTMASSRSAGGRQDATRQTCAPHRTWVTSRVESSARSSVVAHHTQARASIRRHALARGQLSLFGSYDATTRSAHVICLLFYALSLMPFASILELIDDCSPHVSMIEFFLLFPSFQSFLMCPSYCYSPVWFRPPAREDGLHPLLILR